jgi:hypothetical protein
MRLFRLGLGKRVEHVPGRREELLLEIRQRFGPHVQGRFGDQADAIGRLLDGDDGLSVAAEVVREFAEAAHLDLLSQAAELHRRTGWGLVVDRRNYRPLWRDAGSELRWPLFGLPGGLHPYVQVAAAVTVLGDQARRAMKVTDPVPVLAQVFEVLDLTLLGWEFARVRVDADYAGLADRLIVTARDLRDAMGDPPPLPEPVRELMRRNNTLDVHDAIANRIVRGFNPGKTMREALLA